MAGYGVDENDSGHVDAASHDQIPVPETRRVTSLIGPRVSTRFFHV